LAPHTRDERLRLELELLRIEKLKEV